MWQRAVWVELTCNQCPEHQWGWYSCASVRRTPKASWGSGAHPQCCRAARCRHHPSEGVRDKLLKHAWVGDAYFGDEQGPLWKEEEMRGGGYDWTYLQCVCMEWDPFGCAWLPHSAPHETSCGLYGHAKSFVLRLSHSRFPTTEDGASVHWNRLVKCTISCQPVWVLKHLVAET